MSLCSIHTGVISDVLLLTETVYAAPFAKGAFQLPFYQIKSFLSSTQLSFTQRNFPQPPRLGQSPSDSLSLVAYIMVTILY